MMWQEAESTFPLEKTSEQRRQPPPSPEIIKRKSREEKWLALGFKKSPEDELQYLAEKYDSTLSNEQVESIQRYLDEARTLRAKIEQKPGTNAEEELDDLINKMIKEIMLLREFEIHEEAGKFLNQPPEDIVEKLKKGVAHPRLEEVVQDSQRQAAERPRSMPEREKVLSRGLPYALRDDYQSLGYLSRQETIPLAVRQEVGRAVHFIENRYFEDAASVLAGILKRDPVLDEKTRKRFEKMIENFQMFQEKEKRRLEELTARQKEILNRVREISPERKDALDRRELTERILREGKLVGKLRPILVRTQHGAEEIFEELNGGSKPMLATFELEINGVQHSVPAIVKAAVSERFLRPGVTPGSGPFREVLGAAHAVAFGIDNVPAVAAREFDDIGLASVHELIKGAVSCYLEKKWYQIEDENFQRDLELLAAEDYLVYRADGAPRNYLIKNGRLWKIDCGVDMPSAPGEFISSAPLMMMRTKEISPHVLQALERFRNAGLPDLFMKASELLPEEMTSYLVNYVKRMEQLARGFYPDYDEEWLTDFSNTTFLNKFCSKNILNRLKRRSRLAQAK